MYAEFTWIYMSLYPVPLRSIKCRHHVSLSTKSPTLRRQDLNVGSTLLKGVFLRAHGSHFECGLAFSIPSFHLCQRMCSLFTVCSLVILGLEAHEHWTYPIHSNPLFTIWPCGVLSNQERLRRFFGKFGPVSRSRADSLDAASTSSSFGSYGLKLQEI